MPEGERQQRTAIDLPGPKTKTVPVHTIYRMTADYAIEIYEDALLLWTDEKTKEALYFLPKRKLNHSYVPLNVGVPPFIALSMDELATTVMKGALRHRETSRLMISNITHALDREPQE